MRLQRLTQLERHKIVEEHEQTLALIEDLKGILASEQRVMGIIKDELAALKSDFGDERRTEILEETTDLTIEDLLADEEMVACGQSVAERPTPRRVRSDEVAMVR
jgi:DNA gyrase subunit A